MIKNAEQHFSDIHLKLPIAPQANHRLRSAPEGKLPTAMIPAEALDWIATLHKEGRTVNSIELEGPGDALALPQVTFATLELLKPEINDAELSITSLGLGAESYTKELARLGVKKVNLLVDTVQAETAAKLYSWIRPGKKNVPLPEAVEILITDQAETVSAMNEAGITVVIRTTLYPTINDNEIIEIAEKMAGLGATKIELAVAGDEAGDTATNMLQSLVAEASTFLTAVISEPGDDLPPPGTPQACEDISMPKPTSKRPNVAVVSTNGMDVDMHLGQAFQVLIYGPREDGLACFLETRDTPDTGATSRWQTFAKDCLHDCFAILASHAGDAPRKILAEQGIRVIFTDDNIEGLVDVLYGGGKKGKCKK